MIPYLFFVLLFIVLITDLTTHRIPNAITFPFMGIGLSFHVCSDGIDGLFVSAAGLLSGFALMLVLYLFGGVGAGDVKLFAAAGALLGTAGVFYLALYAVLFAGLIGAVLWLVYRLRVFNLSMVVRWIYCLPASFFIWMKNMRTPAGRLRFPFMLAVFPGALAMIGPNPVF